MEMRRAEDGMRFWLAEPGEYHMSYSGELGGLWRRKGAPPQSTVRERKPASIPILPCVYACPEPVLANDRVFEIKTVFTTAYHQ